MARKAALILFCLVVLITCGPPRYEKQTIQQYPLFKENYIVRDQGGQKIGTAIKINEDEYRFFHEDGGKAIILRDPLIENGWLIYDTSKYDKR